MNMENENMENLVLEAPLDIINLLIFKIMFGYDDRRRINMDKLSEVRELFVKDALENGTNLIYYNNKNVSINWDKDYTLDNFLDEYADYFYLDGDEIVLREEISYLEYDEMIWHTVREQEIEPIFFGNYIVIGKKDCPSVHKYLGINKIKNILNKYLLIEEKLEKEYMDLDKGGNRSRLNAYMVMREMFLQNLSSLPAWKREVIRNVSIDTIENEDEIDNSMDKWPIDFELLKNSKYFVSQEEDILNYSDEYLSGTDEYALYSKSNLSDMKLDDMIQQLVLFGYDGDNSSEMDIDETVDFVDDMDLEYEEDYLDQYDPSVKLSEEDGKQLYYIHDSSDEERAFYLIYIDKIDKYMEEYGIDEELVRVRNRLLYAYDMPSICLYRPDRLSMEIEKVKDNIQEYREEYDYMSDNLCFMAEEVFLSPRDEFTIRKLLHIATYYEMTRDKEIISNVRHHKHHENYQFYSKVIFGDNQRGKRRVLKKK